MELNSLEMFALLLCSCLLSSIVFTFNIPDLATDRAINFLNTLCVAVVFMCFAQHYNKQELFQYLSSIRSTMEKQQIADLEEAHRRRILALKRQHDREAHQLRGSLDSLNAELDHLDNEHNWLCMTYQDLMRKAQEQQDRITYLEGKFQESGKLTPAMHPPFSAPPSQIQFANPQHRSRVDSAMRSPVVRERSPLARILEVGEAEKQ